MRKIGRRAKRGGMGQERRRENRTDEKRRRRRRRRRKRRRSERRGSERQRQWTRIRIAQISDNAGNKSMNIRGKSRVETRGGTARPSPALPPLPRNNSPNVPQPFLPFNAP
jgi:hypothetical protein